MYKHAESRDHFLASPQFLWLKIGIKGAKTSKQNVDVQTHCYAVSVMLIQYRDFVVQQWNNYAECLLW